MLNKTARFGRRLGAGLLLGSGLAFFVGMLLPAEVIGWLRTHLPILTQFWDGLNAAFPALNPLHVLWYAWMSMLWWLAARRKWRWFGVMVLVGLSGLSEALQLLVEGRTARLADVFNDMLGIAIGVSVGALVLALARGYRGGARLPDGSSGRPESSP